MTSNLADNFAEGHHNSKCTDCKPCFEYINVKDKLLIFKSLIGNKIIGNILIRT